MGTARHWLLLKSFYIILFNFLPNVYGNLIYGMCGNPTCSVLLGEGVTLIQYISSDDVKLSFNANQAVEIYGKEFGPKKDLWGVMVNGFVGFVPNKFVRETKSFVKNLVPATVDLSNLQAMNQQAVSDSHLIPSDVQHTSQVFNHEMYLNQEKPDALTHSQHFNKFPVSSSFPSQIIETETFKPNENLNNYQSVPESVSSSSIANTQIGDAGQIFSGIDTQIEPQLDGTGSLYSGVNTYIQSQMDGTAQGFNIPESSSHIMPSVSQLPNREIISQEKILQTSQSHHSFQSVESINLQDTQSSSHSRDVIQSHGLLSNGELSGLISTMQVSTQHLETASVPQQPLASFSSQIQENIHLTDELLKQSISQSNIPVQNDILPSVNIETNTDHMDLSARSFQTQPVPDSFPSIPSLSQEYEHNKFSSGDVMKSNVYMPNHVSSMVYNEKSIDYNDPLQTSFHQFESHSVHQAQSLYPRRSMEYADYMYKFDYHKRMAQQLSADSTTKFQQLGADYVDVNVDEPVSFSSQNLQQNSNFDNDFMNPLSSQSQHHIETSFSDSHVNLKSSIAEVSEIPSQSMSQVTLHSSPSITSEINQESSINFDLNSNESDDNHDTVEDSVIDEGDEEEDSDDDTDVEEQNFFDSQNSTSNSEKKDNLEIDHHSSEIGDLYNTESQNEQISGSPIHMSDSSHKDMPTVINDVNKNLHTKLSEESTIYFQTEEVIHSQNQEYISQNSKQMQHKLNIQQLDDPGASQIPSVLSEAVEKLIDTESHEDFQESDSFNSKDDHSYESSNISNPELSEEQKSKLDKVLTIPNLDNMESGSHLSSYQIRNLKGEQMVKGEQNTDSETGGDENATQSEFNPYITFENGLEALRSFLEAFMLWIPDPLYTMIMDLDKKGIPPRVPVFTAISAVPCLLLIIAVVFIKERSKEKKLLAQLMVAEKNVYVLSAEKNILEEKLENAETELASFQVTLEEERDTVQKLNRDLGQRTKCLEETKSQLENSILESISLKERENEYCLRLHEFEKEKSNYLEQKESFEKRLKDQEITIAELSDQLQEMENELKELKQEKLEYLQSKEDYEEKLTQFQQNCNQLLQEAEVWNMRVSELNMKLNQEVAFKEELANSLKVKDEEVESLKLLVETFKSFDEIEGPEEEIKTKEKKMQSLINSSSIMIKLQNQEEENRLLSEKLSIEKSKILDMEVEILEAKSEIDKLKLNYNQALQDKAEAQTKLDVLTNYFKDKEIQLQKQLGAQEAVRQKKEEDASSAERRICLIEQENASYKYQVASMKQEMEETERNLKSQIAVQEKKAHENWIAARAAERKLEDIKQEVTQLRQRLTLLEREQENWVNSSRDEIIRPVPKRIPGLSDDPGSSQDINPSVDMRHGMFPPQLHDRMPPPMMLPPDRPLPPLPPPPIPPFLPHLEPHFRPQPWHLPPDSGPSSDFRTTPPEFLRGRESTPPRGRPSNIIDGDMGPVSSSPLGTDTRDSRNSTPPHSLPDFHDIPPQPPRPFFPPPHHSRFPLPPPFRRDVPQGPKRLDNQGEFNSSARGAQQSSVPQERWPNSNTRV